MEEPPLRVIVVLTGAEEVGLEVGPAEEEEEDVVMPAVAQESFSRMENWVESVERVSIGGRPLGERGYSHWNSPVPSTMTSMPYPVLVDCVPGAKSQGTFQSKDFWDAGRPSAMAVSERTQLEPGPWQSTRLTVTPSVGWLSGSQVMEKSLPWVTDCEGVSPSLEPVSMLDIRLRCLGRGGDPRFGP